MKKILAFILMIIVAVTVFTPCCTFDNCQEDVMTQQDATKKNAEGACSPFFSCATCSGFVYKVVPITIPAPVVDLPRYYVVDSGYTSSTYTTLPWQPPKSA